MERICGTCTECCQGWLWGSAHGHHFYPGRPCHFVSEGGCTIYKDRPESPCKTFKCQWLENHNFPEWLKPNKSKVLIKEDQWGENGDIFLDVYECGQKIDSTILAWLIEYHATTKTPMRIKIGGGNNHYGPPEFLQWVKGY
jgi:hypothetical protein